MSDTTHDHEDDHGHGVPVVQEDDHIDSPKIVLIGVVSIIIFVIGAVWSTRLLRTREAEIDAASVPKIHDIYSRAEVGIIYQWPFYQPLPSDAEQRARHQWLKSYGWVDQSKKVI